MDSGCLRLLLPVLRMSFISGVVDGCPLVVPGPLSTSNYYACAPSFEVGKLDAASASEAVATMPSLFQRR